MIEEALVRSGMIRSVVMGRDFGTIHRFLRNLYDSGAISREVYSRLLDELSELALLDGEEFIKRARRFAEEVEAAIFTGRSARGGRRRGVLDMLLEDDLSGVHRFLRNLYDSGAISREVYSRLLDELSELALLDGEEFIKRARRFAEEVERVAVL